MSLFFWLFTCFFVPSPTKTETMRKSILSLMILFCLCAMADNHIRRIDLSGTWLFALDREATIGPSDSLTETIQLPGTTDTNKKGYPIVKKDESTHLSRLYTYQGRAWYKRIIEIPDNWRGLPIHLFLERTKPSEVYIDSKIIGSSNDISTPQVFDLSAILTPGKHELTIMIDNGSGVPQQLYASSHAYTEDTQTNWNGIIGKIEMRTDSLEHNTTPEVHPNFRNFHIEKQHFYANGHKIFLRGKHDACVWPLTGHVAMDVESWHDYLSTCAAYGLNHIRIFAEIIPDIRLTFDFDQRSKYHTQDLYNHTLSVVENVIPNHIVKLSALFHDIGKAKCFQEYEKDGNIYYHFIGHPEVSKEMCVKALKELRYSNDEIEKISFLVEYHDYKFSGSLKNMRKFMMHMPLKDNELLMDYLIDLKKADTIDHINVETYDFDSIKKVYHQVKDNENECYNLKSLKINGSDLLNLGYSGKIIGEILNKLVSLIVEEKLTNDRNVLLKYVKENY